MHICVTRPQWVNGSLSSVWKGCNCLCYPMKYIFYIEWVFDIHENGNWLNTMNDMHTLEKAYNKRLYSHIFQQPYLMCCSIMLTMEPIWHHLYVWGNMRTKWKGIKNTSQKYYTHGSRMGTDQFYAYLVLSCTIISRFPEVGQHADEYPSMK